MSYVVMRFHHQVWYHTLSLCYACIQSSGIVFIPWVIFVPNFVSFAASIAELVHGEKSCTHSAFDTLETKAKWNMTKLV